MSRRTYGTGRLYTRTTNAGVETWYGSWRVDGRRVNRRLGEKKTARVPHGLNAKQAEAALRDAIGALTSEELERLKQDKLRGGKTLTDVLDAYLLARDLKESTGTDYRMHVRLHLAPWFEGKTVDQIKPVDIERLIVHLQTKKPVRASKAGDSTGLKTKTVRTYLTTLSTLLNYAVKKGWAKTSPMVSVDLPPMQDHDAIEPLRFLRVHEVNDLVAAVGEGPYRRLDRALYLTAALTGLRQGELRGLEWEAVDWTAQRVHVRRNIVRGKDTSPKSRKVRTVPLAPQVAAELELLHAESAFTKPGDPVFADPYTGKAIARHGLMDRYRVALAAGGIDTEFRFHDLRHTMGTTLAMAGVDVVTIQAYMGHSDLATTMRYMHYAPAENEAARIGAAFAVADPRSTAGNHSAVANSAETETPHRD